MYSMLNILGDEEKKKKKKNGGQVQETPIGFSLIFYKSKLGNSKVVLSLQQDSSNENHISVLIHRIRQINLHTLTTKQPCKLSSANKSNKVTN